MLSKYRERIHTEIYWRPSQTQITFSYKAQVRIVLCFVWGVSFKEIHNCQNVSTQPWILLQFFHCIVSELLLNEKLKGKQPLKKMLRRNSFQNLGLETERDWDWKALSLETIAGDFVSSLHSPDIEDGGKMVWLLCSETKQIQSNSFVLIVAQSTEACQDMPSPWVFV